MKRKVAERLKLLDAVPGVYIMKNINKEIIYVGKAKNLINRVTQYFTRDQIGKTAKMVSEVADFDFIITQSEKEALLLEMNLIHEHMPKYNIMLKDGSSYPYIALYKGDDPYLAIARHANNKKAEYFGPYPNSSSAREVIDLLNRLFPLKKCKHLPKKSCLYYDMGLCLGPCINKVSKDEYNEVIKNIRSFMNGNVSEVKKDLLERMKTYSSKLEFENANECKKTLESIEYTIKKQSIVEKSNVNKDVFAFHIMGDYMAISTLVIRNGLLLSCISEVENIYGDKIDSFVDYIYQFYEKYQIPKEVVVPNIEGIEVLKEVLSTSLVIAKLGNNAKLVNMAGTNAIKAMEAELAVKQTSKDVNSLLDDLKKLLKLKSVKNIELIDNSHIHGDANVSAVVVFTNGIPNKKKYRKYAVSEDNKADDYGAMREIIYRRYYRKLTELQDYADLLLVDGGLGQVHAALEALNELMIKVPVFGLVKNDKHQTRAIIDKFGKEYDIQDNKQLFFLLTRMQDEVHRYVIEYHRNKKVKSLISSALDEIKGLGTKRKMTLLEHYGTVSKIKEASIEELSQYVPINVARELKDKL